MPVSAGAPPRADPRPLPSARPWTRWLFRIVATAEVGMVFAQAAFAGGFLAGHYELLALHTVNGRFSGGAAVAELLAAILLWRPGPGPGWPALACAGLLVAVSAQIYLGFERVLAIHIPLGVAVIAGSVLMLIWAWRPATDRNPRP